jgi:predicted transcriptional regulator
MNMGVAINPQRGVDRWNAKLNDEDVRLILALVDERTRLLSEAKKLTDAKIAEKFDVSENTIQKISRRITWIHVAGNRRTS